MDDVEYARRLFEILTRPLDPDEPIDEYGTGADRIDRYGGFGTDLRVTSIDVVAGEHGNQIDIGFELDLPADVDVPGTGSLLLPLDAEWREASGFDEPSSYAPIIASRLMSNVGTHLRVHRDEPDPHQDLPDRDTQRAMLLEVLGHEGPVQERPGHFVVRRTGRDDLTVLVTPDQWEQVVRRHGMKRAWLVEHFDELLASGHDDETYLVFWEGDLVRSTREKLPPVRGGVAEQREIMRRLAELRAANPDAEFGWYAAHPPSTS